MYAEGLTSSATLPLHMQRADFSDLSLNTCQTWSAMRTAILLAIVGHLFLVTVVYTSDITSFTDAKCTRSWRALDTVNGYPDGLCKPLNVTRGQSFQVQELDRGCAGMSRMHTSWTTG